MPLKKNFSKTKNICKVTFSYPAKSAKKVAVAGDFNGWDTSSLPMKKDKEKKIYTATVELDAGKEYQFRYFIDGERWENDTHADGMVSTPFPDCENCVVSTKQ
jgi:1,4-alpha-glucan branching enzyme